MKICVTCKIEKELNCFHKNKSRKDGLCETCKECRAVQNKRSREKNIDKIKVRKHEYYLENKEHIVEKNNNYIKNNKVKHNEWATKSRKKLKTEVCSHYGNGVVKCNLCEESRLHILTIDHISGGGNKHRREEGIKTGYSTYSWLKKNNYPEDFQVLCFNCQFKKRFEDSTSEDPTKIQLQTAAYVRKIKEEVLSQYGKTCSCGESDLRVLTLDHVNDGGRKHKEEIGKEGYGFYLHLKNNNFPNDPPLQTMCMNCQYEKRHLNEQEERKNRSPNDCEDAKVSLQ